MSDQKDGEGQEQEEGEVLVNSAVRFVRMHPEFGIIPLLLISVPILAPFVPKESAIGPIIYVALVLVLLPMVYKAARLLVDKALAGFAKTAVNRIFQWLVGFATVLLVISLIPLLGLYSVDDGDGGNPINRLAVSIWEIFAKSEVCEGSNCTEPTESQVELDSISGVAPRPQDDPLIGFIEGVNEGLGAPGETNVEGETYADCIKRTHEERDAEAIVACADILDQ